MNSVLNRFIVGLFAVCFLLQGCAEVSTPDARNVKIPAPVTADERRSAVNERPDSVMYLPLGEDILVPARIAGQDLPEDPVGPFELRSETLAGALQLILADYDIAIAFETDAGLNRMVTVSNLKGSLDKVVGRVCSLADLYCSYEDGAIIVKDTQTFTVVLPPLADAEGGNEFIDDVIQGLTAILGNSGIAPVSDPTTRTLIYSATNRTSALAANYFQRLRANTAMIVFETYIWEVSLNSGNSTGIDWSSFDSFGKFNTSIGVDGSIGANFTNPISIGLPTTDAIGANPTQLVEFLSTFGAVKTISQPQITVLSGSAAELRVADTENYVSEVTSTVSGDQTTTSVSTDSVDSGFTLSIDSSWDKATVYANVAISLTNVDQIENFAFDTDAGGGETTIQLPQTSERELATQIRVRPGDSVLIGGLVRETDNFDTRGPGFMEPILPDSRTAQTSNLELVILMRPRVVVYTDHQDKKYQNYVQQKTMELRSSKARPEWVKSTTAPRSGIEGKELVSPALAKPRMPVIETPVVKDVTESSSAEPARPTLIVPDQSSSVAIEGKPETVIEDVLEEISQPIPVVPNANNGAAMPSMSKLQAPELYVPIRSSGYVSQYKALQGKASDAVLNQAAQPSVPAVNNVYQEFEAGRDLFSQ